MMAASTLGWFVLASMVASAMSQNPEWGPAPVHPKEAPAPKAESAAAAAVASGLRRALDWLDRAQRRGRAEEGWGWGWAAGAPGGGDATPLAVLALRLSNDTWLTPNALRSQLAAQQVDMDVLVHLWRHHEAPISPGRLAHYTLALHAICRDPRHFHGHDLVGSLLHHESPSDQEFAIASLSACSSGAHVRKRQIRRLLDVADKAGGSSTGESDVRDAGDVDTLSTVLLALDCIVREHRNRNLEHYVRRPARGLARLQAADGSFGTRTRSTALALQALVSTWEEEPSWNHLTQESPTGTSWNRTAALISLLSHQGSDGSFGGGDVVATAEAALALAGRGGIGAVRNVTCPSPPRPPSPLLPGAAPGFGLVPPPPPAADHTESSRHGPGLHPSGHEMQNDEAFEPPAHHSALTEIPPVPEAVPTGNGSGNIEDAVVTYTLWVGSNISENLSLTLKAPKNSSFYGVMVEAAQQDERFQFSSSTWPNGHYIHTIHGYREQPAAHRYWLLYRLPTLPDPSDPPSHHQLSPKGVDDLLVNDGDHFLFWYRKL